MSLKNKGRSNNTLLRQDVDRGSKNDTWSYISGSLGHPNQQKNIQTDIAKNSYFWDCGKMLARELWHLPREPGMSSHDGPIMLFRYEKWGRDDTMHGIWDMTLSQKQVHVTKSAKTAY